MRPWSYDPPSSGCAHLSPYGVPVRRQEGGGTQRGEYDSECVDDRKRERERETCLVDTARVQDFRSRVGGVRLIREPGEVQRNRAFLFFSEVIARVESR